MQILTNKCMKSQSQYLSPSVSSYMKTLAPLLGLGSSQPTASSGFSLIDEHQLIELTDSFTLISVEHVHWLRFITSGASYIRTVPSVEHVAYIYIKEGLKYLIHLGSLNRKLWCNQTNQLQSKMFGGKLNIRNTSFTVYKCMLLYP